MLLKWLVRSFMDSFWVHSQTKLWQIHLSSVCAQSLLTLTAIWITQVAVRVMNQLISHHIERLGVSLSFLTDPTALRLRTPKWAPHLLAAGRCPEQSHCIQTCLCAFLNNKSTIMSPAHLYPVCFVCVLLPISAHFPAAPFNHVSNSIQLRKENQVQTVDGYMDGSFCNFFEEKQAWI